MAVPYIFGTATSAIPLSQLDTNFATPITIGNTAVALSGTITTLNNMTLANVTISSGNVTITNVAVTTANVTTANIANSIITTGETLSYGTANGVAYLNGSKVVTTGSALVFDGTNLGVGVTPSAWGIGKALEVGFLGSALWGATQTQTNVLQNTYYSGGYKYASTNQASYYSQISGEHKWYIAPSGTAGNAISFTQAMTLDASGNWLLGTTSTSFSSGTTAEISGSSTATLTLSNGATPRMYLLANSSESRIASYGTTPLTYVINGTERARITSSGYFKASDDGVYQGSVNTWSEFNQSANSIGLSVVADNASFTSTVVDISVARNTTNNTYYFLECAVYGVAYRFRVADSGNVTNTNNSYGAISDARLKENVTDATPKLEKLNQVRIVNFNMIGEQQKQIGVIAQELEQIFPGMVDESPDRDAEGNDLGTTTKSVKYSVFVPMLIKALQEQQAIIESLKSRLDAANL